MPCRNDEDRLEGRSRERRRRTGLGVALTAATLMLAGCSDINLHNNPPREIAKQTGPLTVPPAHLKDGSAS